MGRVRWAIAGIAALTAAVFYLAVGANIVGNAQRHDFLNLYTGATLAHEGDFARLDDADRQFEIERKLVPDLPALVPFVRPPVYAAVLAPLATMPLKTAFWVWVVIQVAILMVCWAWAARRFGANGLMWAAVFLPTVYGIANGQDCAMMLLLMIVAYELAERESLAASGFAIGLALFKFHLLLLFPVLMIVSRRWRMLAGYCAAAGIEIGGTLVLSGKSGMVEYVKLLQRKDIERLSPSPEMMSNIHAIAANLGIHSTAVSVALAGLVVATAVYAAFNAPLWRWFAAGIAGSLLMVPHVYGYDAAVLLLPILLAIFQAGTKLARYSAMAIALPCVFWLPAAGAPWAMGPALAIFLFLISAARERRWNGAGGAPAHGRGSESSVAEQCA
jgi:hypothetical protein